MKTRTNSRYFLSVLIVFVVLVTSIKAHAQMDHYCITPPFIVSGVKPNLLMMLDNSASMYDLTYISSSGDYCYDTSYDDAKPYEGYFDQTKYYKYDGANGRFNSGAVLPGSCTYRTDYVCINITGTTVDDFIATGKFLNWLSSSKFDVQKKILTGGKYDAVNTTLVAESRGCVGRRFIKRVLAFADITFGIRGPNALEPDYTDPETQGGLTRIEIFRGTYNNADCQLAIERWQNDDPLGQWTTAASDCLGISGGGGTASGRELATFIESVRGCWHIKDNIKDIESGKLAFTEANLLKNITINNLMTLCTNVYTKDCPDPNDLSTCAAILNNESGGSYICARTVTHLAPSAPYYSFLGSDTLGFAGRCWSGAAAKFVGNEACVKREFLHYCGGYAGAEVIDPSGGSSSTSADNIPAVIRDASVRALGNPLLPAGSVNKYFSVKVTNPTAPTGLIQKFSEHIRFGAINFNYSGSPTECDFTAAAIKCPRRCSTTITKICSVNADCPLGETCVKITNLDGGKIIHHIGYVGNTLDDSVGDHSSGLIYNLDNVVANAWTPLSEGFYNSIGYFAKDPATGKSRTDVRIHATDFDENKTPSRYDCQANNLLLITDGMSTADLNSGVYSLANNYNDGDGAVDIGISTTCPVYAGSRNVDDLAWLAKHRNIKTFIKTGGSTATPQELSESITTYVVFNGKSTSDAGECNPETLLKETARNGCGLDPVCEQACGENLACLKACNPSSQCYQKPETPEELYAALEKTFLAISGKAASGTAASVLASGEGSGANLIQAIFYPSRDFNGTEIAWSGSLKNLWFHLDPHLGSSTIREDTNGDKILHLIDDRIVSFYFNPGPKLTFANLSVDTDGDGDGDGADTRSPVYFEEVMSLWEAGAKLWATNPGDRVIFTTTNGNSTTAFTPANVATLRPFLLETTDASASRLISYIRGHDKFCSLTVDKTCSTNAACLLAEGTCVTPLRNRTVANVDLNNDGDTTDTVNGVSEADPNVWKLGDIVNSTPRIASWVPLNKYHKSYLDLSYKQFIEDKASDNTDIVPPLYKNRGMVFVGANDGMLHAFRLGKLELFEEKYKKAALSGTDIGKEEWAFIPQNVLPYLQYFADSGYCHIYSVDLTTYIIDASICAKGVCPGNYWTATKDRDSWRTILIGGMRLGGACKNACTVDINGDGSIDEKDCVETPANNLGYSSYFALDVTNTLANPVNPPELLWEFSHPDLGFSTSGPAIVRISPKKVIAGVTTELPDNDKNGRWFVVLGSGPTGPINTATHQFMGYSDQNLKVFVLDLKGPSSGLWALNTDYWIEDSGIQNAFSGSMINAAIDFDQDNSTLKGFYQDDAVYFGYAQAEGSLATSKWTKGGVLRLFTKNSLYPGGSGADNPAWALSPVIENIGPVTSAVAKLQNYKDNTVRLFFGTGRYFYKIGDVIDDQTSTRRLYGLIEPCYSSAGVDFECDSKASAPDPADDASGVAVGSNWYIPAVIVPIKQERKLIVEMRLLSIRLNGMLPTRWLPV